MDELICSKYESYICALVNRYILAKVEIVDDVATWCAENSEGHYKAEDLPNPIGKALWKSRIGQPNRILLKNIITPSEIDNHLLAIFIKGFTDVHYRIDNNIDFLKHLILHEIAHIKHDWNQSHEKDCDKWAFEQLEIIRSEPIVES